MKKLMTLLSLFSVAIASQAQKINPGPAANDAMVLDNAAFAGAQTRMMLYGISWEGKRYPRTAGRNGDLITTNMYDWTSGFFPGTLWYLYELTGENYWKNSAEAWTATLEPLKNYTGTHDLGFMIFCSFGNGYRLAPQETAAYKDIIIDGAGSLCTRFRPATGCIQSWPSGKESWHGKPWQFPVIIDNMMNLEMLMWAAKNTDDKALAEKFRNIAVTHANTTMKNHLRPDYSSFHVIDYDTINGSVRDRATCQGWSDNSTWARGQAWGIYGFSMMYRETGDRNYLETAEKMLACYLRNLPDDMIPYWDFNASQPGYTPNWPDRTRSFPVPLSEFPVSKYRDASAAAVVASALLEIYGHTGKTEYRDAAIKTLRSLSSPQYRAVLKENGNFIIKHCVGSIPHGAEIDVPLTYADYYFLEALMRYARLPKN